MNSTNQMMEMAKLQEQEPRGARPGLSGGAWAAA
jgi:hypothetical protein